MSKFFTWIMNLQMKILWNIRFMCCLKNRSNIHHFKLKSEDQSPSPRRGENASWENFMLFLWYGKIQIQQFHVFRFWFLAASGKSHYFYSIEFLITKKSLNSNTKNSDYTAGKFRDLETNQIIDRITCDFQNLCRFLQKNLLRFR